MCLIIRDILPAQEKRLGTSESVLRWRCLDPVDDVDIWLTYYATDRQRAEWAEDNPAPIPVPQELPYARRLPGIA